jgi:branched-chain amino acid transport system substrate-binding protein
MLQRSKVIASLMGLAIVVLAGAVSAQEQFIRSCPTGWAPMPREVRGSLAGTSIMNLVNIRDGGINGVKLTWEECETEYNNARGVGYTNA